MSRVTLVLGGARSGKSRLAEGLAEAAGPLRSYVATAEAFDEEMRRRIAAHRDRRGTGWETLEAPTDLAGALSACRPVVLVDCLTLWLNNLLYRDMEIDAELDRLCGVLGRTDREIFLVSNEIGLGIVPDNALSRRFRDAQGLANQKVAAVAQTVYFVAAGLPLTLKSPGPAQQAG